MIQSSPSDKMAGITPEGVNQIHDASMEILAREGVCFNSRTALDIFASHGFRHENGKVRISETQVRKALETVPAEFTIHARNPENNLRISPYSFVLLHTVGALNIAGIEGNQRPATLEDFKTCCDLVQSSRQLDMGGWLMVQPNDIPLDTAHLDMLLAYTTRCDKPLLGAFGSDTMAKDTFGMAEMIFGGKDYLRAHPVTAMIINALTPLQFSGEQTDVLIQGAELRQPLVISNMALAGSTAPVRLPGLLALINAEILAGMVLSQLVGPGTPVVYGTTSAPMDMKTTVGVVGAWETVKVSAAAIRMARYYNLPCRTGGSLNDAHIPDGQAMAEGSLLLSTAIRNGANFILHACGQMASFMAVSFEKWLMDEELCRLIKGTIAPLDITEETIDIDTICSVGAGGEYLTHPSTFSHFKTLSRSDIFNRRNHKKWQEAGAMDAAASASAKLKQRLEMHTLPPIDEGLKQELEGFVARRKA